MSEFEIEYIRKKLTIIDIDYTHHYALGVHEEENSFELYLLHLCDNEFIFGDVVDCKVEVFLRPDTLTRDYDKHFNIGGEALKKLYTSGKPVYFIIYDSNYVHKSLINFKSVISINEIIKVLRAIAKYVDKKTDNSPPTSILVYDKEFGIFNLYKYTSEGYTHINKVTDCAIIKRK